MDKYTKQLSVTQDYQAATIIAAFSALLHLNQFLILLNQFTLSQNHLSRSLLLLLEDQLLSTVV